MKDRNQEPRIVLPHIEKPSVDTGMLQSARGCAEAVTGFTEAPKPADAYNYDDCRYHWVGNGYGPVAHTYFADFSAMVSGAVCMEIRDSASRKIAGEELSFTEDLQKTPVIRIARDNQPYQFDSLTFIVRNEAGMESSVCWPEKKTGGTAKAGKRTSEPEARACLKIEFGTNIPRSGACRCQE